MNYDFLTWFFYKHYIIAAVLFPELAVAWGAWMKWWGYVSFAVCACIARKIEIKTRNRK